MRYLKLTLISLILNNCMKNINSITDELKQDITFQLVYTGNFLKSFRRIFHTKFVHKELHPDIFSILFFITCNPSITQAEIARILFKGKAHVGKILNEMERLEIIKREHNGKLIKNIILPKGEELHKKAFKEVMKTQSAIYNEFTPEEVKQFTEFITRYRNVLGKFVDIKLK